MPPNGRVGMPPGPVPPPGTDPSQRQPQPLSPLVRPRRPAPWSRRRGPAALSLRGRLLAVMVALLAALCLVIGSVTALAMNQFLMRQIDKDLEQVVNRSTGYNKAPFHDNFDEATSDTADDDDTTNGDEATGEDQTSSDGRSSLNDKSSPSGSTDGGSSGAGSGESPGSTSNNRGQNNPGSRSRPPGPGFLIAPGLPAGTVGATVQDGHPVETGYLASDSVMPLALPHGAQTHELAEIPPNGRPYTRNLGELGEYRLVAWSDPSTKMVQVIGLPLAEVQETMYWLVAVEALVALLAMIIAFVTGRFVILRTLRPLRRVAATAGRVAEIPMHAGDVAVAERVPDQDTDPRTEVGQVGAALNRLLGQVDAALTARQASETRLRQFIADASHELRTPLAAIRGYAELGRRSAADASPEMVQVLGRVEAQATRMTGLVEDLLLLARLDAGRPLERTPVDLSALVVEGVGDAYAAGPRHRWRLALPDEPVEVIGDCSRLHQVLANLLANARTHTPTGTTVTVGLSGSEEAAIITVTDDGPGISAGLLPSVFERFARGDSSRSRLAGSTGLGLSIVSAVVTAHGGDVGVRSRPGETVFSVRLPVRAGARSGETAEMVGAAEVDA